VAEQPLRIWPDPVLSQICAPVSLDDPDLPKLIDDLIDTMYAAKGRGLAAPQIGVLKRVFVVDVTWKEGPPDLRVFINPEVALAKGEVEMDEQCLSIPDLPMPVARPEEIMLRYADRNGKLAVTQFTGILARCIQHETDHLDGKVIFDHQSPEDRATLEAAYVP